MVRLALALVAVLASCEPPANDSRAPGDNTPKNTPKNTPSDAPRDVVAFGNRYSAELASRSAAEQRRLMAQVVRSADESCPSADRVEFKGQADGQAFWAVDCGRSDWLVAIEADSSTRVMDCAIATMFKNGCWERWKE